jgi:anaerobic selenocysteine-containing dehydrogenase
MFPKPATGGPNTGGRPGIGRGISIGRHRSRVRGAPEVFNELPIACLAEEILTPGDGQIRALICLAGNPVVSSPDSDTLDRALASLELMVAVDIYVTPTSRHADVILPAESPLQRGHYDFAFYQLSCRNVANYSPAAVPLADESVSEWEILLRLAAIAAGQGPHPDLEALDEMVAREILRRGLTSVSSPAYEFDDAAAWHEVRHRRGPERILDILLRTGPYGDGFGRHADGLTLARLEENPHGLDLGPLAPRIPEVLRTSSGKIELAPDPIVGDVERLTESLTRRRNGGFVLVGRRHVRSNNSWMHNLPALSGGTNQCTMHIHPDDAERIGLKDGQFADVSSKAGSIGVVAEVSDTVMPGVISIPHGWSGEKGPISNVLSPSDFLDPLSGNAVLNGIPVTVEPV